MSTPNTSVWVCRGVKTDKTYNHVLLFGSASARFNYFTSKAVRSFDRYTYQRTERYLTIGVNSEIIEECNYLVFINRTFSDKVYYAFIDRIEYVSDSTSRIYFTMDIMQTWFPDCTLHPCFIDRQHAPTDNIGDNLVADDLQCGDYVDSFIRSIDTKAKIAFLCTFNADYSDASGDMLAGMYNGLVEHKFDTATEAGKFIDGAVEAGKADGIVSCYMSPGESSTRIDLPIENNADGYAPRNKKLFTYPYCYHRIFDSTNKLNVVLKDEYFRDAKSSVREVLLLTTGGQGSPEIGVLPLNYKTYAWLDKSEGNRAEAVYARPYPTCAYNTDIYKAYMAQNASSIMVEKTKLIDNAAMGAITNGVGMAGSLALMSNPATFGAGAVGAATSFNNMVNEGLNIAQYNAKFTDMDRLPPQTNGSPSSSLAYMSTAGVKVYVTYHTVTRQYAKIIDDYWTVYGYPYHSVQIPNITSRSQWNYIRCGNSCITGPVPADALRLINDIFNRGVTFWHNPENVGRYELSNNIV